VNVQVPDIKEHSGLSKKKVSTLVSCKDTGYNLIIVIRSFRHKGLEKFYATGSKAGIQAGHASKLRRILGVLDAATQAADINLPGFRLHSLTGERKGFYSVWVNANWRVIFRFDGEDVELVDYLDYH
jgi:proteic killer suppression protein